jgi:SAM-dependent methyltransferase
MAQLDGWHSYEQRLVPLFATPLLPALLDEIGHRDAVVVVDLACGTGATARGIHDAYPNATVLGVDFDPAPLLLARASSSPELAWLCASATALPFPGATVDVVVCQQGLQFMPLGRTARNVAFVLRPGGILVGLSWCSRQRHSVFYALHEVASELGWGDPSRFDAICSFDPDRFRAAAEAAGLHDVRVAELSLTIPITDPSDLLQHWCGYGTAALSDGWQRATDDERRRAELIFQHALGSEPTMDAYLVVAHAAAAN